MDPWDMCWPHPETQQPPTDRPWQHSWDGGPTEFLHFGLEGFVGGQLHHQAAVHRALIIGRHVQFGAQVAHSSNECLDLLGVGGLAVAMEMVAVCYPRHYGVPGSEHHFWTFTLHRCAFPLTALLQPTNYTNTTRALLLGGGGWTQYLMCSCGAVAQVFP